VLAQPAITSAIVGASKAEQLDQTLPAADLTLDERLLATCDDIWYQLPVSATKISHSASSVRESRLLPELIESREQEEEKKHESNRVSWAWRYAHRPGPRS
jgi:hypothetical protein